jgi:mRNA interferase RelE/StbE
VYELLIERRAERELLKLDRAVMTRINREIMSLANNPRPAGCRKLVASPNDWRIRVGDYRVVYEVDDKKQTVRVFRVRHRKDAYK